MIEAKSIKLSSRHYFYYNLPKTFAEPRAKRIRTTPPQKKLRGGGEEERRREREKKMVINIDLETYAVGCQGRNFRPRLKRF